MKTKVMFLVLIMGLVLFGASARTNGQEVGTKAPDFTLEALGGEKIALSDALKTKLVVLDFWASWCPHCIKVIPELEKFYTENKDKVEVIGVNVRESKAKVAKVAEEKGVSYPIVLDSDGAVAGLYSVRGIPTIVAIDKQGTVIYYGYSAKAMMEEVGAELTMARGEVVNDFCPVLGTKINKDTPFRVEYQGRTIGFCCAGCVSEFQADPEKYLK